MDYLITCFVLVAFGASLAIAYSLRKQRDAAMQEVATISQRLTDIEKKLDENVGEFQTFRKTSRQEDKHPEILKSQDSEISQDLSAMTDEELFLYITKVIREQELYRWPDFNRAAVMTHFSSEF